MCEVTNFSEFECFLRKLVERLSLLDSPDALPRLHAFLGLPRTDWH
jgi:hypothetical protein